MNWSHLSKVGCGPRRGHPHSLVVEHWTPNREKDLLPNTDIQRQCFPLAPTAPTFRPHTATGPCPCAKNEKGLHRHYAHTLFLKWVAFFVCLSIYCYIKLGAYSKHHWASLCSYTSPIKAWKKCKKKDNVKHVNKFKTLGFLSLQLYSSQMKSYWNKLRMLV